MDRPNIDIFVVDNDASGSSHKIIKECESILNKRINYSIEPRRGIPFARNASIKSVGSDSEFIAIIDDDEYPDPYWLDELLSTQKLYNADIVSGPVIPEYNQDCPEWIIDGKFFERERFKTGHRLKYVATNNVLMRKDVVGKVGEFDTKFALNGGDDTHFFLRAYYKGFVMVWSNEAIVYESIPKSRTNMKWLLQRSFRLGNSITLCEIDIKPSLVTRARRLVLGICKIIQGLLILPIYMLKGKSNFVKSLRFICRGAGMIYGTIGRFYNEYKHVH